MNYVHTAVNTIVAYGEKAIAFVQPAFDKVVSVAGPVIKSVGEKLAPYVAHPAFAVGGLVVVGAALGYEMTSDVARIANKIEKIAQDDEDPEGKNAARARKALVTVARLVVAVALAILIVQKIAVVATVSAPVIAVSFAVSVALGVVVRSVQGF